MAPVSFKPRSTLPQTAFTLPARYYTDAGLFEPRDIESPKAARVMVA